MKQILARALDRYITEGTKIVYYDPEREHGELGKKLNGERDEVINPLGLEGE